jgi:predicted RNA-binding protein YlxR (DUF448 family)
VVCRSARPKRELTRIVRTPDGHVLLDPTGRLAGRGAYLCADRSCWQTASTKRALDRALATPLPPDVLAMLAAGALEPKNIEGGARGQE